jgi:CheY-like chemotaxis protein
MKNLLIVETDPLFRETFTGLLKNQSRFLEVFSAGDIAESLNMIDQLKIHMVIIGHQTPEMETFKLATHLVQHYPGIRIMILANDPSPMFRVSFKSLAGVVLFERICDIRHLSKRIFTELGICYGGCINGISLSAFLQMMAQEKRSCTLQIMNKKRSGLLFFIKGELVSAKFGAMAGFSAALEMLCWKNVSIEIDFTTPGVERDIDVPIITLLMESLRLQDEQRNNAKDHRRFERFDCMMAMDYDHEDWIKHCFLWDISLGGAYIETEQPLSVGAFLVLGLPSPNMENHCKVNARVVRRDKKGMGVCFENISSEQKKVILNLTGDRLSAPNRNTEPPEQER